MSYGTISNEWLNKNNLETLWAAIVRDFVHAGANAASSGDGGTTKGSIPYWGSDSTPTGTGQPKQPDHLQIGTNGQFLGVSASGIPQWQSFGTPSLALAGTDAAPTLTVTVQGETSTGLSLPMADSTHAGLMSTANQGFSGNKTFYGKVTVGDQLTLGAAQGTAPIIVTSSTKVANLNADLLDGKHIGELFTDLSNTNDKKISITVGGVTETLQVGYASVAGSLDVANKAAWGVTYWNNGTPQDVSGDMSSVGNIEFSASGKTIGGFVKFDTSNARLGVALGTGISPDEALHVGGNISANWGVSAEGIADMSLDAIGGGGGTVTKIAFGNVSIQSEYEPVNGLVTLPNNPAILAWNNDYQTITSTEKTNWGAMYARVPSATFNTGNELADKAFVNSSIGTATADFKGTVTAAGDSEAQAQTALASITGMDNNDYAFVKVENTPQMGVDKFKRYKYNGTAWVYEYTLNNSSFTANQWSAINSGITSTEVTRLATVATGAQVNVIEVIKRNGTALTIDANKAVDISVPTALSQLTDDATHRLVTDTQKANWNDAYNAIPILSNAIGQVSAMASDNRDSLLIHDTRIDTLESYFSGDSASKALQWNTSRTFNIQSSDGTGSGATTSVNGTANVTLKLPSTITATLVGDVTGNLTGNADTATKFSTARTIKLTGDVTGSVSSDGSTTISEGVTGWSLSATIANSAVTTDKINNLAVTTDKIAANAVTNAKLANSTIYINGTSFTLGDSSTQNKLTAKWGNARNISITDGTHTGNATSIDGGSASYSLALPSIISASFVGDLQGNSDTASKLLDNTAYKLWGVEFFKDGVPKNGNGNMTGVGDITFLNSVSTIGGFLKVDTTLSRLGIGLGENVSPSVTLDVNGNTTLGGVVKIGTTASADVYLMRSSGDNYLHIPTGASLTIDHRTAGSSDNTARLTIKSDGDTWVRRNLIVDEHITGHKNIMADWGVSAEGIADLSLPVAGGGGGDVTSIKFDSSIPYSEGTSYTAQSGELKLPAYPSLTGYALETWVTTQITNLGLGTASTHAHGDYVTAVSISGTNLSVTNGDGNAVTTAINAATLQGHAADYFALASYFTNGVANNAARLSNTSKIGDTNQPVYFTANGVPAAISYTIGRNVAANEDVTPYTQGDSINITNHVVKVSMTASDSPSASGNSISFIDTIAQNTAGKISATKKTIYTASSTQLGLVKVGTSLAISDGVLNVGTGGVTNAMLAGSIANNKLSSDGKFTIGSQDIELGTTYTQANMRSYLGLGTASTHAHNDYVTGITWDATNLKLKQTKGSDAATDIVQFKSLTIKGGTTSIGTYSPVSALEFSIVAGTNISVTPDATNHKITIANTYSLPTASDSTLGGVKIGSTLEIDNSGVLNQKSGIATVGTYRSVTVDTYGRVTAGTNPTTLAGYGITDASLEHHSSLSDTVNDAHVIQLGNKTLYLKFRATQGDATTNPQTLPEFDIAVADNAQGQNEQTFHFGTISESDIVSICHL